MLLPAEMASTFTANFALVSCPGAAVLSDPAYFNSSMLSVLCITLLVPTELFAVIGLLFDFDSGYYVALPGLNFASASTSKVLGWQAYLTHIHIHF